MREMANNETQMVSGGSCTFQSVVVGSLVGGTFGLGWTLWNFTYPSISADAGLGGILGKTVGGFVGSAAVGGALGYGLNALLDES